MKLSKQQIKALDWMTRVYGTTAIDFRTGESLRRKGLAGRHTQFIIKAVYVEKDATTLQYKRPAKKARQHHEWYITRAGKEALAASTSSFRIRD